MTVALNHLLAHRSAQRARFFFTCALVVLLGVDRAQSIAAPSETTRLLDGNSLPVSA